MQHNFCDLLPGLGVNYPCHRSIGPSSGEKGGKEQVSVYVGFGSVFVGRSLTILGKGEHLGSQVVASSKITPVQWCHTRRVK